MVSRSARGKRACCFHPSVSADRRQAAPSGPGWAHELKHDGYRLQIQCPRWSGGALHDQWRGLVQALSADRRCAEVVWIGRDGVADFDAEIESKCAGSLVVDPTMQCAHGQRRRSATQGARAVMDAAGIERATVMGVSEGGSLAALFAATYPERCSSLILYGAFPRFSDWSGNRESNWRRRSRLPGWSEAANFR